MPLLWYFLFHARSLDGLTIGIKVATPLLESLTGTENGTVLDKTEILDGMNFVTSPTTAWNYRASGEPWNFWFIYNIINKPSIDSNGISEEDTRDKIYTVYFDDIRQLRAAGNRADHIGLFFKIKYFGPAVAVSYQQ